jgi:ATP-dependent RNA helicase DeaD
MTEASTFSSIGLRDSVVATLTALGYEAPTPIQERTIPPLLAGKDLIGQAQTGTGKTAAFALPILQQIDLTQRETQALVLAPTRELAMQVAEAIHSYARGMDITVLPVYGGAPIVLQMKHLARGAQIVVGTPGRLIDHLDRETLRLGNVRMVVLDEADEMLKMGFLEDVERILSHVPKKRQIALFSATMPHEVRDIAERHLESPVRIEIEQRTVTAPAIEQRFLNLSEGQKLETLTQILELEQNEAVLIFRRTKNGAAELAEKLEARGFAAVAMHGDMSQTLREGVIRRLRAGTIEIVVATDVAARGLDVEQISHVVNYDVPYDVEAYVHRIGRTGRAGRTGTATLFITPRERGMMRAIERYTGSQIKAMKMPSRADIAARRIALFKENLRAGIAEGDLDLYVEVVTQLADEGPFDMSEVAAAAARLANGSRSLAPEKADARDAAETSRGARPATGRDARPEGRSEKPHWQSGEDSAPRAPRAERPERTERPVGGLLLGDDEPKVTLSMAVGRNDGIRPADVVGSIANEADVPGSDIGPIDIHDDITYVTIPERFRERVLEKVGRAKFRGRAVNLQVATGPIPPRPQRRDDRERPSFGGKRPFTPRDRGDSPRPSYGARSDAPRSYTPRDRNDAPRSSSYTPRDRNDAPRSSSYTPRDRNDAPRERSFAPRGNDRPYTPRDRNERPAYDRNAAPRPGYRSDRDARPAGPRPEGPRRFDRDAAPSSRPGMKPFFNRFGSKPGGTRPGGGKPPFAGKKRPR